MKRRLASVGFGETPLKLKISFHAAELEPVPGDLNSYSECQERARYIL